MKSRTHIDMTTGPLWGKILRFILPLIATNLLQQFYHAADIMVVGLSPDPNAIGAVGATGTYLALIRNIFIGFSVGAAVVTARYIGAKDEENVSRAVHTSICMGVLFGLLGAVVGIFLTRPVLVWMGYTGSLLTLGVRYAYIYLACLPFLALTNILCAVFQAKGDTRTSLFVLSATGILNIFLNLFFVLAVGLSVSGVAIATAVANLVSAVILWRCLANKKDACSVSFKKLCLSREHFGAVFRIGFPAGIQSALFSLSNIIIQSSILEVNHALTPPGSPYDPVIKGSAAAGSIENFIFAAMTAVSTTASAVIGQNVGSGNVRRVRQAFWSLFLIASFIALIMSGGCILLRDPLLALYGVGSGGDALSQIAYESAMTRIFCKWTAFLFYAMFNTCAGTLRGMGKSSSAAMLAFVGTCVFRVVWIYTVFRKVGTLKVIFLSYPVSWILTGVFALGMVLCILRKKLRSDSEVQNKR